MAELQSDPTFQQREREQERVQMENTQSYAQAAKPLLAELAEAGLEVASLGELRLGTAESRLVIPILHRWLTRVSDRHVRRDIVRALSAQNAGDEVLATFIEEFPKAENSDVRWALANGIAALAGDSAFNDIKRLVIDRRFGADREMLAVALGNMKDSPEAIDLALELLEDGDVVGHAVMALGALGAPRAAPHLEPFVEHPKRWIREEAKKALKACSS